jgi:hypothetical protein
LTRITRIYTNFHEFGLVGAEATPQIRNDRFPSPKVILFSRTTIFPRRKPSGFHERASSRDGSHSDFKNDYHPELEVVLISGMAIFLRRKPILHGYWLSGSRK